MAPLLPGKTVESTQPIAGDGKALQPMHRPTGLVDARTRFSAVSYKPKLVSRGKTQQPTKPDDFHETQRMHPYSSKVVSTDSGFESTFDVGKIRQTTNPKKDLNTTGWIVYVAIVAVIVVVIVVGVICRFRAVDRFCRRMCCCGKCRKMAEEPPIDEQPRSSLADRRPDMHITIPPFDPLPSSLPTPPPAYTPEGGRVANMLSRTVALLRRESYVSTPMTETLPPVYDNEENPDKNEDGEQLETIELGSLAEGTRRPNVVQQA
ncbi:hypothetical protein BC832DRAFT_591436 [Gaertneriomyces semiglobifer]|nr:hypothetical protein BC832DRAFT_591436 [Gaertneriomyces semiglobifer]